MKCTLSLLLLTAIFFTACKKDHPGGGGTPSARGSLQNTEGSCLPGTPHGKWTVGLAPGDSNFVDITVHVTQPGTYNIQSDSVNGIRFRDSGVFTATGDQVVHLRPAGYFDMAKLTSYNISFDNSACGFSVRVDTLPAIGPDTWRFTAKGKLYQGHTDGHTYFLPNALGRILEFNEDISASDPDTILSMGMRVPVDGPFIPGSYLASFALISAGKTLMLGTNIAQDTVTITANLTGVIWPPPPPATFQLTAGTFSGTAVDPATHEIIRITNGEMLVQGW